MEIRNISQKSLRTVVENGQLKKTNTILQLHLAIFCILWYDNKESDFFSQI